MASGSDDPCDLFYNYRPWEPVGACAENELASKCPPGMILDPNSAIKNKNWKKGDIGPEYCFGDFIEKVPRWEGRCYADSDTYPSDNISKAKCCTGETPAEQCNPSLCSSSSEGCKSFMSAYCTGSGYGTPECNNWCSKSENESTCFRANKEYCNSVANLENDPYCKDWCINNPGECDKAYGYCRKNPGDPFCSCINSETNAMGISPECVDSACKSTGYLTYDVMKNPCSDTTICQQIYDISDVGGNVDVSEIENEMNCGSDKSGRGSASQMSGGGAKSTQTETDWSSIIIVIIFVMLVFAGIAFFVWKRAKKIPEKTVLVR